MRVLFLTQYYPPEPVSFQPDLVRILRERGHEVTVMTSFPCYPKGKIYDGYRQKLVSDEYVDGVHIVRLPQIPDHSKSALRRILYYTSFMLGAMTIGNFRFDKCDAVIVYEAAVVTGLAGWVLARLHRVPVVFYTVDLWPESVTSTGLLKNRAALRILEWLCGFIYRRADRCVGITKGYLRRFIEMGVKPERTELVYFWSPNSTLPAPQNFDPDAVMPLNGRFKVLYAGNMGPAQDLGCVLGAAALLRNKAPEAEFVLGGGGVDFDSLKNRAEKEEMPNVRFTGALPPSAMPDVYSRADALLVHLKPDALTRVSIPSKVQSYMQAGKPIIMAVEGEAGEFVREHGFGIAIAPSNPAALADTVIALMAMSDSERAEMGKRAVAAYKQSCSPEAMGGKLCSIIEKVAEENRAYLKNFPK